MKGDKEMKEDLFLVGNFARELYENHAANQPIIDYHNHISPLDIAKNRRFTDLYEIWLAPDPYKHRLMRISGIPEHYITGAASPREKFKKFASVFPYLLGNPVYDWSLMELDRIFKISEIPCSDNADYIFDKASEMLGGEDFTCNAILGRFNIEYQSPVANINDDLSCYNSTLAPSLRGDDLLSPNIELITALEGRSGAKINSFASYISAISTVLNSFAKNSCLFADHSLDDGFVFNSDFSLGERAFESLMNGKSISQSETNALSSLILTSLGKEYSKRGWNLLIHLDAKRKTSDRLAKIAGRAGGYAAVGGNLNASSVCELLAAMENNGGLPKTVLFPLNMSDFPALSVLEGSFSEDGVAAKVELGPAWWWCDHSLGMKNTFECISSFGVLSEFIGMTTDSRSILSFVRHDYFRRVLCSWLAEKYESGVYRADKSVIGEIVERISYKNAKRRIEVK